MRPKLKSQKSRRLIADFTTEEYFVRGLLCQLCFQTEFSVILYKLLTTLKTKEHQDDRDQALLMVGIAYEADGFFGVFFFFVYKALSGHVQLYRRLELGLTIRFLNTCKEETN